MKWHLKGRKNIFYAGLVFLLVLFSIMLVDFWGRGIWNEKLGLNLLVVGDDGVAILTLRPKEEEITWTVLPKDLKIKISGSTAMYPIGSLWKFARGERAQYLISEKTVGESVGVILPRVIKMMGDVSVENLMGQLMSLKADTDLSVSDRWNVRKFMTSSGASRHIVEYELPQQVFDKVVEADGKEFKVFSSSVYSWVKNKFVMEAVLSEKAEIVVNNTSGIKGAGLVLSSQLESAGMRVVDIKNDETDKVSGKGCVYWLPKTYESSAKVLNDYFGCKRLGRELDGLTGGKVWLQ